MIAFPIFLVSAISMGLNLTSVVMWVLAIFVGGLGAGCLLKPDSIGEIAVRFFKNIGKDEDSSDSHNKQIQKKSSGIQVMAHDQSKVSITVASKKEEHPQSSQAEKKAFIRKETIVVKPSDGYSYEFRLMKDDHLKGKIVSDNPIDVYFVDWLNFEDWTGNRDFESEDCNEGVLETEIDYVTPRKGSWYLIMENRGRVPAKVKVRLYTEEAQG